MKCGEVTEVFSRCCGYFRPIKNWNKGKREEFKERKTFVVDPAQMSMPKTHTTRDTVK